MDDTEGACVSPVFSFSYQFACVSIYLSPACQSTDRSIYLLNVSSDMFSVLVDGMYFRLYCILFKNEIFFYLKIIVDVVAVVRKNTERYHIPFMQFPPMTSPCKSIVQYHSQYIDIDTIRMQNSSIATKECHFY